MNEIFTRRSIRAYLPTPVEEEKLASILEAGNYAPSAMNNQNRQFTAICSPELLERLNLAVKALLAPASVARIEGRLGGKFSFFYNAPVLIVTSQKPDELMPGADCACSLQNMFLEATALGLGSCWINQLCALCDEPSVRAILSEAGVDPSHKVYGCAAIGYAAVEGAIVVPKATKTVICK